jgi:hypothetical protein
MKRTRKKMARHCSTFLVVGKRSALDSISNVWFKSQHLTGIRFIVVVVIVGMKLGAGVEGWDFSS